MNVSSVEFGSYTSPKIVVVGGWAKLDVSIGETFKESIEKAINFGHKFALISHHEPKIVPIPNLIADLRSSRSGFCVRLTTVCCFVLLTRG